MNMDRHRPGGKGLNMAYRRAPRWAWWLAVLTGMVFGLLALDFLSQLLRGRPVALAMPP
jgi:hypothetical protein